MSEQLIELEPGILSGVTKPTIDKIKKAGITTVQALSMQTSKELQEKTGIGKDTASRAITKAINFTSSGYITGDQLRDSRSTRTRLTTSSWMLDDLLGGGIESETTTEIAGANGTGKTQLCHMLAVNAQLTLGEGGLEGDVAWIDTEDTFRPERILEICENRGYDGEKTLKGIHHGLAKSTRHQKILISELYSLCPENNIKLVIVDSMMGHLRSEYVGRGMLSGRQDELKAMTHTLMKVAQSTKVTVIYTNQMMDDPAKMYGNPEKPIGGHVMGHRATTRLQIRKGRQLTRIVGLTKSPYLPEGEVPIILSAKGVDDTLDNQKKEKEEDADES